MDSIVKEFNSLKELIVHVLEKYPDTRSNDTKLYIQCCRNLGAKSISDIENMDLNIISIHKTRQIVQNKLGLFKPTKNQLSVRQHRNNSIKKYISNQLYIDELNIVVAGTRTFNDYNLLKKALDMIIKDMQHIRINIVSGKADGADTLGEKYAKENGFNIISKPADWNNLDVSKCKIKRRQDGSKYNVLAGINRNVEMAQIADIIVCFWDGVSTGTKNMMDLGIKKNIPVYVVNYKEKTVTRCS